MIDRNTVSKLFTATSKRASFIDRNDNSFETKNAVINCIDDSIRICCNSFTLEFLYKDIVFLSVSNKEQNGSLEIEIECDEKTETIHLTTNFSKIYVPFLRMIAA